jgi:hypothetical protein
MRFARTLLWFSCGLGVFLAFAWPFVVSPDPASSVYRALAMAALWGVLGAIGWIVIRKLAASRR